MLKELLNRIELNQWRKTWNVEKYIPPNKETESNGLFKAKLDSF